MGGMVLETSMTEVLTHVEGQDKLLKSEVSEQRKRLIRQLERVRLQPAGFADASFAPTQSSSFLTQVSNSKAAERVKAIGSRLGHH